MTYTLHYNSLLIVDTCIIIVILSFTHVLMFYMPIVGTSLIGDNVSVFKYVVVVVIMPFELIINIYTKDLNIIYLFNYVLVDFDNWFSDHDKIVYFVIRANQHEFGFFNFHAQFIGKQPFLYTCKDPYSWPTQLPQQLP